jgi:hypothetical protein
VEHRAKTQKSPFLNSPKNILFAKQREFPKFLQNNFLHLVTLFSVDLRVLPFSEPLLKIPTKNSNSNPGQNPSIPPILAVPLLRDPELILFYTSPV